MLTLMLRSLPLMLALLSTPGVAQSISVSPPEGQFIPPAQISASPARITLDLDGPSANGSIRLLVETHRGEAGDIEGQAAERGFIGGIERGAAIQPTRIIPGGVVCGIKARMYRAYSIRVGTRWGTMIAIGLRGEQRPTDDRG